MPQAHQKIFMTCSINVARFALLMLFIVLFGSGRALAQDIKPERPTNPWTGCPRRPPTQRNHAERSSAAISRGTLQTETEDRDFEVEVYLFLGNKARDDGNIIEAKKQYAQALTIKKNEWRAHYGLGNVLFDEARLKNSVNKSSVDKAIAEYKLAVRDSEDDKEKKPAELAELYSDLAEAYLLIGENSEAQKAIDAALKIDPRSASAIRRQGNKFFVQNKFNDAIGKYKESLAIEPDNAYTHQALAAAYFSLNRFDEAIQEYKEAARVRPNDLSVYEIVAEAYYQKQFWKDASEWFSKAAVERNPRLADVRYKLIFSYYKSGNLAEARQEYEKLRPTNPDKARDLKQLFPDL